MSEPTQEQKAQEAAILYTSLADIGMVSSLIAASIFSGSLTMLSEAVRGCLMLAVELYAFVVLRAVHRQRLRQFRFGIGKVEEICNLAIGAALVASGLWVANQAVGLVFEQQQAAATPFGMAVAAVVNAVNNVINFLGWFAMVAASRDDASAIFTAQRRARLVKLICTLTVQATLTIGALAKDPVVSLVMDALGAAFVAVVMVAIGSRMVIGTLPDMLDHTVPPDVMARIDRALARAGVTRDELALLRTRRTGSLAQVELGLTPAQRESLTDFEARAARLQRAVKDELREADVSVVVATADG